MKWLKDTLSDVKAIILAPLTNILCIAGILLILASFLEYDKTQGLILHGKSHLVMTGLGFALVVIGVFVFLFTNREAKVHTKLDYQKGVEIKRGELTILIKAGEIQKIEGTTSNSAIILPANTTFVDDCAVDKRTAMGGFFGEHFAAEIGSLPTLFKTILDSSGSNPQANGQYSPGTTIVLPNEFSKPAKVLITASTVRTSATGIISNPYIICKCVEEILRVTANQRVDSLYLPILGSGHGGVDRGMALLFLLLALLHFSKVYHHIKNTYILVHPKDISGLNESKELRQILAL